MRESSKYPHRFGHGATKALPYLGTATREGGGVGGGGRGLCCPYVGARGLGLGGLFSIALAARHCASCLFKR